MYNKRKSIKKYLAWVFTLLFILNSYGCEKEEELVFAQPVHIEMQGVSEISLEQEPTPEQLLEEYLATLTLEEKIGQLFYVTLGGLEQPGLETSNQSKVVTEVALATLREYSPGGIIIMGGNVESDQQIIELTETLQSGSKIPLFIGIDEEGGKVSRLGNAPGVTFDNVGAMQTIGDTGDPNKAYEAGTTLGSGLSAYGFNMDFAPVADVLTNPANYEIGSRSFGTDANQVAAMVTAEIQGLHEQGVGATTKHFPGHGGVIGNSHNSLQYIDTSVEDLRKTEFIPFQSAIQADTDAVLISHLVLTTVDPEHPSTLSAGVVTGLLRDELGYEGLVITDSFQMASITANYSQGEAAVLTIQAGCDMILMPKEYKTCYEALLEAVRQGEISEEQIDAACYRILQTKIKRGILNLS